mgnify:CR=1 FL=1
MSKVKWIAMLAAAMAMGLSLGCDSGSDDDDDAGAAATGSFAGTWSGNVCGRGLTMVLSQDGTTLSGSYTFTDPTFSGTCSGTLSSETAPATAHLTCSGHDWWYDLTFDSYSHMSGGFYKAESGGKVCDVDASK